MDCLHLFAPAAGDGAWGVFHVTADRSASRLPDAGDSSALEALARDFPGARCVVWVPGSDCLFTRVTLSARQLKQAGNALGWLLEEQVGEDVEDLHLVQAPQQADDVVPLLVVADSLMNAWLAALRGAGLRPLALLPDILLLPLVSGAGSQNWSLGWSGRQVWLRSGPWQGAAIEAEAVQTLLDSALAEQEAGEGGLALRVLGADADQQSLLDGWAAAKRLAGLELALEYTGEPGGDLALRLTEVEALGLARHPFNLLQGDYAERSRRGLPPAWRVAAAFVAVAYGIQLFSEWTGYFYYHHRALATQVQAVAAYHQLFPQEHRIVSLRKQMDAHLQGGGQQNVLLGLLTQLGQGLQGTGLQTQRLDYSADSKVLNVDVDAPGLAQLQSLKQKLEQSGLQIELSSANAQGSGVRGRFKITAGAA